MRVQTAARPALTKYVSWRPHSLLSGEVPLPPSSFQKKGFEFPRGYGRSQSCSQSSERDRKPDDSKISSTSRTPVKVQQHAFFCSCLKPTLAISQFDLPVLQPLGSKSKISARPPIKEELPPAEASSWGRLAIILLLPPCANDLTSEHCALISPPCVNDHPSEPSICIWTNAEYCPEKVGGTREQIGYNNSWECSFLCDIFIFQ